MKTILGVILTTTLLMFVAYSLVFAVEPSNKKDALVKVNVVESGVEETLNPIETPADKIDMSAETTDVQGKVPELPSQE